MFYLYSYVTSIYNSFDFDSSPLMFIYCVVYFFFFSPFSVNIIHNLFIL